MTFSIISSDDPVVLFGGGTVSTADIEVVHALSAACVAADGGARVAHAAGLDLDAVIGDFDSISDDDLKHIPRERQHQFKEQDSTDFDKALRHISAPVVLAVGFFGGRIDHQLASLHVLARYPDRPCILLGPEEIALLCPRTLNLETQKGDIVSLFPLGPVEGQSSGLRWPIGGIAFDPLTTIGTSNEALGPVGLEMSAPSMIVIAPRRCLFSTMQALARAPRSAPWPARVARHTDPPQS
ncbi:MAG: thiamine diphosphokinase [Pseudomonadota bacterium]